MPVRRDEYTPPPLTPHTTAALPSLRTAHATAVTAAPAVATSADAPNVAPESVLSRTSTCVPLVRTVAIITRAADAWQPRRGAATTVPSDVHAL